MMLSCTLGFPVTTKLLCASGTLSSDLVLLPLFLLFPTETDFVSQHFSLFLFYCIPTGKQLEVCIDNHTRDTITAGNFERENLREFWGFAKAFWVFAKVSLWTLGAWHLLAAQASSLRQFSPHKSYFPPICESFSLKNFPLSGIYTCCYLQDPDGLHLTKLLLYFAYMCRVVWTMTLTPQPKSSFVSFKDSCFFTRVRTASWVPLTTDECGLDFPDVHVIVYHLYIATFRVPNFYNWLQLLLFCMIT